MGISKLAQDKMRVHGGLLIAGAFAAVAPATPRAAAVPVDPLGKVIAAGETETAKAAPRGATVQVVQAWLAGHQLPTQDASNGYPFAPPAVGPWGRALPGDSADWVALVTGANASTALNSTDTPARHRRLATQDSASSSTDANALIQTPPDAQGVTSSLDFIAGVQTVQALADFASAVTGGVAAPMLAIFSVALGFFISALQQDAVIKYINAVADAYVRIATAAAKVESIVPSIVEVSLIQQLYSRTAVHA